MSTTAIADLGAGFSDVAVGSQAVFKAVLTAFSSPGQEISVPCNACTPRGAYPSSALILLSLLDADTTLWLSERLRRSEAATWLSFHTGCHIESNPEKANFAWIGHQDELPALDMFAQGSPNYPDQSTTCVYELPVSLGLAPSKMETKDQTHQASPSGAHAMQPWLLSGPGISQTRRLQIPGLSDSVAKHIASHWLKNQIKFPKGVDLLLATNEGVRALPRATQISLET
jgi:alpha-D-ribose 1-methylphosphonate 5-triphosphate synthase subunit PhnH